MTVSHAGALASYSHLTKIICPEWDCLHADVPRRDALLVADKAPLREW